MLCDSDLVEKHGKGYDHNAKVWTGAEWLDVEHGTKICTNAKCAARYKLNYVAALGEKPNHLKCWTDKSIVLVHPGLGFHFGYLRQLWNRTCRSAIGGRAEAAAILLTHPDFVPVYANKGDATRQNAANAERVLGNDLNRALLVYLLLDVAGEVNFDVNDPVPANHPEYGVWNIGFHEIFSARKHDTSFKQSADSKTPFDVVADGNGRVHRRVAFGEKKHKIVAAKPGKKLVAIIKRPSGKLESVDGRPLSASRCAAVNKAERTTRGARTRIGGLWVTMDMKKRGRQGALNQILHLGEMLNTERASYKEEALKQLKTVGTKVRDYAGDCNCKYHQWQGRYFSGRCLLDGFHWKRHKCNTPRVTRKNCNSQAAEQFWARLDRFVFITQMERAHYRFFLKMYCLWHNAYTRCGKHGSSVNPSVSRKRKLRRA